MLLGLIFSLQLDKKSAAASRRIRLKRFTAMKGGNKKHREITKEPFVHGVNMQSFISRDLNTFYMLVLTV